MTQIKEIEKTLTETESMIAALWQEAANHTNNWKNDPSNQIKQDIEKRLNHLFDTSQPSLSDEKKLHYSFYELKEILTKFINKLPGLFDEKGEINEKSLNLLTNFLAAVEELENGEGKQIKIEVESAGKTFFYKLTKISEDDEDDKTKKRYENELESERLKNKKLRERLALLEAAEEDRKKRLEQISEEEQRAKNEIETELASINRSIANPNELSPEELDAFLKRLREIKNLLNNGEQVEKKSIGNEDERGGLKKISVQIKLELQRHDVKQRIVDALNDKGTVPEKQLVVEAQWLLKESHKNYSQALDEMKSFDEIAKFEREILPVIAEQRSKYQIIERALLWGKMSIEDRKVNQAEKALVYLLRYEKLQRQNSADYKKFLDSRYFSEFYSLEGQLDAFIKANRKAKDFKNFPQIVNSEDEDRLIKLEAAIKEIKRITSDLGISEEEIFDEQIKAQVLQIPKTE